MARRSTKKNTRPAQFVYAYLLKSQSDNSYYTGITKDLDLRVGQHNSGAVRSTTKKTPWKLVYQKQHETYLEARKHEKWLKKKNRDYKDKLAG